MERKTYRWCVVPQCTSTSVSTPSKIFIDVPRKPDIRKKWLKIARRKCDQMSATSPIYFCEDHFDLPNDMENYMRYHIMGYVNKIMLKPGCLPSKFECQDRKRSLSTTTSRPAAIKRQRLAVTQEALGESKLESNTEVENITLPLNSKTEVIPIEYHSKTQDKGVQVVVKSNFRSKYSQTEQLQSQNIVTHTQLSNKSFNMSGHVSEVNNERCNNPLNMITLGGKEVMIKTEVKVEPELSECTEEMETCAEHLKCEEIEIKIEMQEDVLDIESQGLKNVEDIKCEVLEEADIEHQLEDGQHEESESAEYLKPEGAVSAKKRKQRQPDNIEDGCTLATGGKNIPLKRRTRKKFAGESSMKNIGTHMLQSTETDEINTSMYTATNKGNVNVNSDNNCTVVIDFDDSNSTHSKMSISNDGEDIDYYNIKYKQELSGTKTETFRQKMYYECEICKITFDRKGSLNTHLKTHTGEKPFECKICQARFNQRGNLKTHLGTHTDEKPFECKICQVKFRQKGNLKSHLRTHSGEKPFVCEICQVRFNQKGSLKTHLKTHTDIKPFECKICQLKFRLKGNLKTHMGNHTDEKLFECEICHVRFNQKGSLKIHLRTHADVKPFECEICQLRFNQKGNLNTHLRTHTGEKPFECEVCQVKFKHKGSLNSHLRTHTGEKLFECKICQRKFNQAGHLKTHMITHTDEKPFECEICKVRFKHKFSLVAHLKTFPDEKPFEYDVCNTTFIDQKPYFSNLSSHTDENPLECEICQVKFKHVCSLRTHLRTHNVEKPFECDICKNRFKHKNNLKAHLRIHTGEKPFGCDVCQRRFNHSGHLKSHLRTHTGEKPFECEICKVRYKKKSSLKAHSKIHAGEESYE